MTDEQRRLRRLVTAALMAAVTAVCSLIAIPNPLVPGVPFTLQVFAVCLAGAVLPPAWAFAAEGVYLLLGAVGLPVFAGGGAGPAVLVSLLGGFLWSYPVAAATVAAIAGRARPFWRLLAGSVAAIAVIYVVGFAGMVVLGHVAATVKSALSLLTFLPWDLVKAVLAAIVATRVRQAVTA